MVFCIGAEYADVVQVLVAVEWWSVVVSTGHVSSSVYAGVAGAGLGVIVITEFELYSNRTMGSFHDSWRKWSDGGANWLRRRRDGAEVAVGRILGHVARLRLCRKVAGVTLLEN